MTGISLDLLSVILFIVLSFACGFIGGHKTGRQETTKMVMDAIDQAKKDMEEMENKKKRNAEEGRKAFIELLSAAGKKEKE